MKQLLGFSLLLCLLVFPIQLNAQNGVVKTYYNDGTIESEISYVNDILDGISIFYFQNGNVREEIPFSLGKVNGPHKVYYQNGLLKEEKSLAYGVLDGLSKIYWENGALKQALNYENGKLLKKINVAYDSTYTAPIESYLAGNRQYKLSKEANIVSEVEICPVPVNGIKDIQNNLEYPRDAEQNRVEGIVTLSVKIDSSGKPAGAEIIKSLNKECDQAAINAIEKTKFLPGRNGNKVVTAKIVLNVEFKIEEKLAVTQGYVEKIKREAEKLITPLERKTELPVKQKEEAKTVAVNETKTTVPKKEEQVNTILQKVTPVKEEAKKEMVLASKITETVSEETPYPVGGIERILARANSIPKKAFDQQIEGEVIFRVEVDKYGVVRDTKLIKGVGYGIDEAIEVAIIDSPFKPAKINGQAARAEVILKIPFTYKK